MPNTAAGLILHHQGITLACNNSMGDTLEARPARVRGEVASLRARCTTESAEVVAGFMESKDPAKYEIQLKTGAAYLIESRASTFHGLPCRLAKVGKLQRWI